MCGKLLTFLETSLMNKSNIIITFEVARYNTCVFEKCKEELHSRLFS